MKNLSPIDENRDVVTKEYVENIKSIAKEYADEHIRESTLDKDLVLKIAKEQKADLVIKP